MDDLFDVAHANAIKMMTNKEDIQFLLLQRQKGRPSHLYPIDMKLYRKEQRHLARLV